MSKVFQVLFANVVCHEDMCTAQWAFNMCSEANIQLSSVMQYSWVLDKTPQTCVHGTGLIFNSSTF